MNLLGQTTVCRSLETAGENVPTNTAIVAFSKVLSKQVLPKGTRVNVVVPGHIWTPLQTSVKRPAECAQNCVFFATQVSSYITGEVFGVTGDDTLP